MSRTACPICRARAQRVIFGGFPMKLCPDRNCSTLFGFWSWVPGALFPFNGVFMAYSGSYWRALAAWLAGGPSDGEAN